MDTLKTDGGEFEDGELLTFTKKSWNNHSLKIRGILKKEGDQWVIEYRFQGL